MKILHVITSVDPGSGGPAEGLRQLCAIYKMGGHEIEVASLDSPEFEWLWFDWRTLSYLPFKLPPIGQHVTMAGPR